MFCATSRVYVIRSAASTNGRAYIDMSGDEYVLYDATKLIQRMKQKQELGAAIDATDCNERNEMDRARDGAGDASKRRRVDASEVRDGGSRFIMCLSMTEQEFKQKVEALEPVGEYNAELLEEEEARYTLKPFAADSSDESCDGGRATPVTYRQWNMICDRVWFELNARVHSVVATRPDCDIDPNYDRSVKRISAVCLQLADHFGAYVSADVKRMLEDIPRLVADAMSPDPPPLSRSACLFLPDSPQAALVDFVSTQSMQELKPRGSVPLDVGSAHMLLADALGDIAQVASSVEAYERWAEEYSQ